MAVVVVVVFSRVLIVVDDVEGWGRMECMLQRMDIVPLKPLRRVM